MSANPNATTFTAMSETTTKSDVNRRVLQNVGSWNDFV